jgi:hypothetical protein
VPTSHPPVVCAPFGAGERAQGVGKGEQEALATLEEAGVAVLRPPRDTLPRHQLFGRITPRRFLLSPPSLEE